MCDCVETVQEVMKVNVSPGSVNQDYKAHVSCYEIFTQRASKDFSSF